MRSPTTYTFGATSIEPSVQKAAEQLLHAATTETPCSPVRHVLPDTTLTTGYAVQHLLTADRLPRSARRVGRKIGLTSPAVQAQLGVGQPDLGRSSTT